MSKTAVTRFLESVGDEPTLGEFQAAMNESVDAIVRLGASKGFTFDSTELREAIAGLMRKVPPPDTLSDMEMEDAVGGTLSRTGNLKQLGLAIHNYHSYHSYHDTSLPTFWSIQR